MGFLVGEPTPGSPYVLSHITVGQKLSPRVLQRFYWDGIHHMADSVHSYCPHLYQFVCRLHVSSFYLLHMWFQLRQGRSLNSHPSCSRFFLSVTKNEEIMPLWIFYLGRAKDATDHNTLRAIVAKFIWILLFCLCKKRKCLAFGNKILPFFPSFII